MLFNSITVILGKYSIFYVKIITDNSTWLLTKRMSAINYVLLMFLLYPLSTFQNSSPQTGCRAVTLAYLIYWQIFYPIILFLSYSIGQSVRFDYIIASWWYSKMRTIVCRRFAGCDKHFVKFQRKPSYQHWKDVQVRN